ncbi:MAG: YggT family protein [Betaproteobacteria bacterium HGW-Betaproteobacteria-11]|nr:MAG: YggT family protein [Betaproteobacteria bacterium HGW-Betaproteobacteria-14]PKO84486.1 MAG: YggT family protein [Betaproteobacteria bacterium HGW-Betaproteobacteria-11]
MLMQTLLWLLDMLCGFFSMALLARFLMQWTRAPFRNPLGKFIAAVTDWMLRPLRRLIPGLFGLDLASLLLAWLWQAAYLGIALGLSGAILAVSPAPIFSVALLALIETVKTGFHLAIGVVLISAILSWVNPQAPLADVINAVSRPLLHPFQRLIPPVGGVDLSPLALLLLLQVSLGMLERLRLTILMS